MGRTGWRVRALRLFRRRCTPAGNLSCIIENRLRWPRPYVAYRIEGSPGDRLEKDVDCRRDPARRLPANAGVEIRAERRLAAGERFGGRAEDAPAESDCRIDAGVESERADAHQGADRERHRERIDRKS